MFVKKLRNYLENDVLGWTDDGTTIVIPSVSGTMSETYGAPCLYCFVAQSKPVRGVLFGTDGSINAFHRSRQ
jgi:hypothetical protein